MYFNFFLFCLSHFQLFFLILQCQWVNLAEMRHMRIYHQVVSRTQLNS